MWFVLQDSGETSRSASMPVKFKVGHATQFGETIKIVGGVDALGNWDVSRALNLEWSEDDIWIADVGLPPGECEFKV